MIKKDGRANNGRKAGTTKNKVQGQITKAPRKTGSQKKDDSNYTALTNDEFLKVREGETQQEWEKRTKKRRPLKLDNGRNKVSKEINFLPNGSIQYERKKLTGLRAQTKTIIVKNILERPHNFMKHYALVMRWASIRFGITKDCLEIGFYFYDREPFTIQEFNLYCIQLGTVRGMFSKFYQNGYVYPISVDLGEYRESKDIRIYSLSVEFLSAIKRTYDVIAKLVPVSLNQKKGERIKEKDLTDELLKMYEEAEEIIKGIRKPELIRFRNETKE
jgi:hypothetical protein